MVDLSKVRMEENVTHLFIPTTAVSEIRWLLNQAGVKADDCYMRTWRPVLNHQVPEIKNISDAERDAEIDKYYGEDAKYVKSAPAVILSHYNVDDLIQAFNDTLFGDGDADYEAHSKARQAELDAEGIPDQVGIHIMSPGSES